MSFTSAATSAGGMPLIAAKIFRCSSTVSTSKMMLNWGQIPTSRFISAASAISATGEPYMVAVPLVGWQMPHRMFRSVDFPAPLCPSRAVIWPS